MDIQFYNTLTRQKEKFSPGRKDGVVAMYHCGPTVYDYAHLGNLRAYVFADVLRRTLEYSGYETKQVTNITDVGHLTSDADEGEDKMTKALRREGKPMTVEAMRQVADFYTNAFVSDLDTLNILRPHAFPRASEHISEQIAIIKELERFEYTYATSDGIYYDISKFQGYGAFARLNLYDLKAGARVAPNPEKRHPADFALWKFNKELGWESPWGRGFPGWHIECSAMSMKHLGSEKMFKGGKLHPKFFETIDIHTGGTDHIPVHHTNEIAQSEAATDKQFVRFWMHAAFVNIEGAKMAKSEGNFLRLQTAVGRGISPLAYRYWLLTAHYRSPVTFSWEALQGAQTALSRLARFVVEGEGDGGKNSPSHLIKDDNTVAPSSLKSETNVSCSKYREKFLQYIHDDLDTPKALALVWELAQDQTISLSERRNVIADFDHVFGLGFREKRDELLAIEEDKIFTMENLPADIKHLVLEREAAREAKDFLRADKIRETLSNFGWKIEDAPDGARFIQIKR